MATSSRATDGADDLRAEAEHVHVVVLDRLVGAVEVVADRRADAGHLAGRDRRAGARAADEDAALGLAALDRLADLARLVRVVDADLGVVSVPRSMTSWPSSASQNGLPEVDAAVVERDGDLHAASLSDQLAATAHGPTSPSARSLEYQRMAVLIASNLRKEIAGAPLFDGVSFKVERTRPAGARRGRTAPARRRCCARSPARSSLEGGELALGEGRARRAARPAAAGGERAAAARLRPRRHGRPRRASRRELRELEQAMAGGDARPRARSRATRAAQARLEHAGGYDWRDRAAARRARARLHRRRPRPAALDLLGRRADARLARARARVAARPAAARRADEPPRHRVDRVARGAAARRSTRP